MSVITVTRGIITFLLVFALVLPDAMSNIPPPVDPPKEDSDSGEKWYFFVYGAAVGTVLTLILNYFLTRPPKLRFEREEIEFTLSPGNMIYVTADYYFVSDKNSPDTVKLVYPLPDEDYLQPAECITIERICNGNTRKLEVNINETEWYFDVVMEPQSTTTIHVEYNQKSDKNKFKYLLTTAKGWESSIKEADFAVKIPNGYNLDSLSYSYDEVVIKDDFKIYQIEMRDFKPEKELVFSWIEE